MHVLIEGFKKKGICCKWKTVNLREGLKETKEQSCISYYSRECKQTVANLARMLIGADRALENRTIEREWPCYSETFWKEERKSCQRHVTMVSAAVGKRSYLLWNGKGHGLVHNPLSANTTC